MKKQIIIIGIIMFVLLAYTVMALDNCKGTMNENEIPCLLLLPVNQTTTPCNTLITSVYDNGSTLRYTETMGIYSPFKCNNTFNLTSFGTYTGQYGTGDTFTIVVEEDEFQQYYLYVAVFLVFVILIVLGHWLNGGVFTMIAGILAMVIGINIFNNGFPNLVNVFLRNSITVVIWGVGAYLFLAPAIKMFDEWGKE